MSEPHGSLAERRPLDARHFLERVQRRARVVVGARSRDLVLRVAKPLKKAKSKTSEEGHVDIL